MAGRSKQAKMARLIDLVKFIQDNKPVTAKKVAERFSIPEKTVYQDLRELNAVGIPVYCSSSGLQILPAFSSSSAGFTADETVLLSMGLTLLLKNGTVDRNRFEAVHEKIAGTQGCADIEEYTKTLIQPEYPVSNVFDSKILSIFHNAVQQKQRLLMRYHSRNQKKAGNRELSPYTIVYRKQSWYAIGYCHSRREVRTFKLSRVESAEYSNRSFFQDEDFDADEYLMYRWYIMGGEPHVVIVRFDEEVGSLLLEKKVANGTVWEEDGVVYLQTLVAGLEEFSWWIMQYGEHAEILQPRELRRMMAKRCAKMSAMYSKTLMNRSWRVKR